MRYSQMFIPTLREDPAESEAISHKLLVRGGFVRQLAAGLYIYLPLGWRVLRRINAILKEEMDVIGAQEMSMPILHPSDIWEKTGRWSAIGEEMFRLKDRNGRDMCLGMTHEEIMTWLAALEIRSYRDLPQSWYQIQTKLRDEARPKSGILRTREFIMKDSYSFDRDEEGLNKNYELHAEAYDRIFNRCGLRFMKVESDPGMMGGATAHEYMAPSAAGEDKVAICPGCDYKANVELALSVPPSSESPDWPREEIHTPDRRTVVEVTGFLKVEPKQLIKSLLFMADDKPVLALIRGDQELHEKKLSAMVGGPCRPAAKDEVRQILNVEAGFIGPVGLAPSQPVRMIADPCLKGGVFVAGANKPHHHIRGIRPETDFTAEWADIHVAQPGDACSHCGKPLKIEQVIEIGNIFKLGTRYSAALEATYLDEGGQSKPIVMGSYGIGPARIMAAAVEQRHDANGMSWPESIAPFGIEILPLNVSDEKVVKVANKLYNDLKLLGHDILLDDRDERPGVKLKDADLIGIPWQIVIGDRGLKENILELKIRRTGEVVKIAVEGASIAINDEIRSRRQRGGKLAP